MAQHIQPLVPLTYAQSILSAIAVFLLYAFAISIYRLFFHPLRNVPGPRLAAVTQVRVTSP
jgi:hypothetical protein